MITLLAKVGVSLAFLLAVLHLLLWAFDNSPTVSKYL